MSATSAPRGTHDGLRDGDLAARRPDTTRRRSTETKASFKTTEFFAYLASVVGVLMQPASSTRPTTAASAPSRHGST